MGNLLKKGRRAAARAALKAGPAAQRRKSAEDQLWLARVLDAVKRFPAYGAVYQKTVAVLSQMDELVKVFGAARERLEDEQRAAGRKLTLDELRERMTDAERRAIDEHRHLRDELETALGIKPAAPPEVVEIHACSACSAETQTPLG